MRSAFLVYVFIALLSPVAFSADAEWGHMRGRFVYDGDPIIRKLLEITKDVEAFGEAIEDESLIVNKDNMGIANVVIYLLTANDRQLPTHPSYVKDACSRVTLEIKHGRFSPHVVLARTTQTIVERSGDKVGHNANIQSVSNPPRGALFPIGKPVEHRFPIEERFPMLVRCNIHPWERAIVVVRSSPYMAKTDADGRFEIQNLPVGQHTFRVWHERTGYVRNVRLGSASTDSKGRLSISIRRGTNTLMDASLPDSMFMDESAGTIR